MIEAAMIWNEPNNLSHWDFEVDRDWRTFSTMTAAAGAAIAAEAPALPRVLGGSSPIDPACVERMARQGALGGVTGVAVHAFPRDWIRGQSLEWPAKRVESRRVTSLPVWVSEVG